LGRPLKYRDTGLNDGKTWSEGYSMNLK
jgi:hypothetical protein